MSLKSAYSIRLYELMKKWQKLEVWEFAIDDLKGKFGISKEKYKQYGHFKSRIIVPAVKDVNEKTDVQVNFKEIRKGRKIVKIAFSIKHCKEKEIKVDPVEVKPKKSELDKDLFDRLNELTDGYELSLEGFKRIERIAKKIYTKEEYIEQLERLIEFINVENRLGGIDKPVGLMIHIMEEKEKLSEEGYNSKIENTSSEVVPDWFKDRNKPKEKVEKTKEQLEQEEQERQELDAILAKYREKDPETVE